MSRVEIGSWTAILAVLGGALHGQEAAGTADWARHPVNRWVRQSPRPEKPAPDFPYEGSGSYDADLRQWIHHGGHDGIPQGFHTFTFDLQTGEWKQRFPPTSPPGACCVDGASVYDRANRKLVRFPGGSLGHGYQWPRPPGLLRGRVAPVSALYCAMV
jgi:hypothetical protein